MSKSIDVVNLISTLLDNGKYKEALNVPNEERLAESFKDNCWDLISVIIGKIQDDTIVIKPSLYGTCEQLLTIITEKSAPEEALLEFIEQIELAKNDAQFGLILPSLQDLLRRLSLKRGRSLEWCLNSISTYIEHIPIPDHNLEGQERLLMDSDPNCRRITKVYSLLPSFYRYFITELNTAAPSNEKTKQILTAFLISLLGKPLIYIDMDPGSNDQSEARLSCSTIVQDICLIEKNVYKFLEYVETCYKESKSQNNRNSNDDEKSPYDHREKINMTTLSAFFYTVLAGHFTIPEMAIPQVYSVHYVLQTVMLCVVHLLDFVEYSPLAKGMALCEAILYNINGPLSQQLLSSVHFDMCKGLVNVAIYSSYESLRKRSVALIGSHVNKFDYKGRCALVQYLIKISNHSGMIGYAITLYKNAINEAFKEPKLDECFTGPQFSNMLKKICLLPHGAESDLVELADQIITSLNFLRYLTIKDIENLTGIQNCFSYIENTYLEQLRLGLNMSKAHYEVKLKDIEEGKHLPEEKLNVSINVGGNVLDKIPAEKKKEIICSALNAFHLIEGLIARLSECINVSKMQGLKMNSLKNGRRTIGPITSISVNNSHGIRSYSQVEVQKDAKLPIPIAVSTSHEHEHEDTKYEENIKNCILHHALEFVPKSGWSVESLSAGAKAAGYPTITHGIFPNGGADLVHYFNVKCNEQLVEQMKTWPKMEIKESTVPSQFIENAIMTRLTMIDPYKSTWPKAMAIQTIPSNVPNCLATLLSLVDDICYHSGDRSVDFNWYTRRVGLAGIYKAAELFYLTDSSQSNSATRNFVASRIRDAQLIQAALNLNPVAAAPQTLTAAFTTAKNILGINTLK